MRLKGDLARAQHGKWEDARIEGRSAPMTRAHRISTPRSAIAGCDVPPLMQSSVGLARIGAFRWAPILHPAWAAAFDPELGGVMRPHNTTNKSATSRDASRPDSVHRMQ